MQWDTIFTIKDQDDVNLSVKHLFQHKDGQLFTNPQVGRLKIQQTNQLPCT